MPERPARVGRSSKPVGIITRGTTHPQRLRRVDRWLLAHDEALRGRAHPVVIDLGFGAVPRTTAELLHRLRLRQRGVSVLGLEIDPERVRAAAAWVEPGLRFEVGGFELGMSEPPAVVRAMNVLRQYPEAEVAGIWARLAAGVATDGLVIEGTCDELGRLATWVAIGGAGNGTPRSLTFAANLATLGSPTRFAERLPKALIHRNVEGEPIHRFLTEWGLAWERSSALAPFGPRARFVASATQLRDAGWPLLDATTRWRLGELTVAWAAVAPVAG